VTPFIWGQDRLANFIPFIVSLITDPHLNLAAHLLIFSASFFALLLLCARVVTRLAGEREGGAGVLLAFSIAVLVSMVVLTPFAAYVFVVEGQPYALSYLLLLFAVMPLLGFEVKARWHLPLMATALFVATGLNPSIVIPGSAVACGHVVINRSRASLIRGLVLVAMMAAMFVLWGALSKWYGTPIGVVYSSFDLGNTSANVVTAIIAIAAQVRFRELLALIVLLGMAGIFWDVQRPSASAKAMTMVWLFVGLWVFVLAHNQWIKLNGSNFRYYFPFYLALLLHLTLAAYAQVRRLKPAARMAVAIACSVAAIGYLARPFVPMNEYGVLARARVNAEFSSQTGVRFIAGRFWEAWPLVFELAARGEKPIGLSYRAEGNRQGALRAIEDELDSRGELRVLCVSSPASECVAAIVQFTKREWKITEEPCPDNCVMLTAKPVVAAVRPPGGAVGLDPGGSG